MWLSMIWLSLAAHAQSPNDFKTPEYYNAGGLDLIQAADAYARGYTGLDIIVAVMDTGFYRQHPKFEGRYLPGFDMYNYRAVYRDYDTHGTHVAGTIAAGKTDDTMHGVAYEATILPVRVLEGEDYDYDYQMSRAIRFAYEQGATISNNSWGYVDTPDEGETYAGMSIDGLVRSDFEVELPKTIKALQTAIQSHDQVFVYAAGNLEGTTWNQENPSIMGMLPTLFPEFATHWVTVVNTSQSGVIHESSHYCGAAADWCIAAPGTDIVSTVPGDTLYDAYTGTSMATPHVSGGLAVMAQAFPNLTGAQLTQRLFKTADKTAQWGEHPEIYGQGMMNLNAATAPIGELALAVTDVAHTRALKGQLQTGRFTQLNQALAQQHFIVVDSFDGAPFSVPASHLIARPSIRATTAGQQATTTAYQDGPRTFFHLRAQERTLIPQQYSNPYLAELPGYDILGMITQSGTEISTFQAGVDVAAQGMRIIQRLGTIGQLILSLEVGYLAEDNQALGLMASGSLGHVHSSPTVWQGMRATMPISPEWQLDAAIQQGRTDVGLRDNPWVSLSSVTTQAWQVGSTYTHNKHQWQLSASQPVTIIGGQAILHLPTSMNAQGEVMHAHTTVGLRATGAERRLASHYTYNWAGHWSCSLQTSYRHHINGGSLNERAIHWGVTHHLKPH